MMCKKRLCCELRYWGELRNALVRRNIYVSSEQGWKSLREEYESEYAPLWPNRSLNLILSEESDSTHRSSRGPQGMYCRKKKGIRFWCVKIDCCSARKVGSNLIHVMLSVARIWTSYLLSNWKGRHVTTDVLVRRTLAIQISEQLRHCACFPVKMY
jgi:hypothetical protein